MAINGNQATVSHRAIQKLEKITKLEFGDLMKWDTYSPKEISGAPEAITKREVREISSRAEIVF